MVILNFIKNLSLRSVDILEKILKDLALKKNIWFEKLDFEILR